MRRTLVVSLCLAVPLPAQIAFGPPTGHTTPGLMSDIVAGDVDEDGQVDLVTMPLVPAPDIASIFLGDGSGDFAFSSSILPATLGGRGELRDIDGDGHLDLLLAASLLADIPGAQWRLGAGDGSFGAPAGFSFGFPGLTKGEFVHALDLDGDGDLDFTVVLQNSGWVWVAVDGGTDFTVTSHTVGAVPHEALAGDLDGDGVLDLVSSNSSGGSLSALIGLGGGEFAEKWNTPLGGAAGDLLLGDLDGDGSEDAIVADSSHSQILTLRSLGDGSFSVLQHVPLATGAFARNLERGDLDGDGVDDLLVSDFSPNGGISLLKGTADGSFHAVSRVVVPFSGRTALADMDGDGDLDAAVSPSSNQLKFNVLLNQDYPAGSPFTDLGQQQSPSLSLTPIQVASGTLLPGTPIAFEAFMAPPSQPLTLVLGFTQAELPFKGYTMVPSPDVLLGPFPSNAQGHLALAGTWPAGVPSGLELVTQFWFPYWSGPAGLASSNAVKATVP